MNDKFKQLALQAKMATADFDAGSYYVATPAMMQQFCELIVQDLIERVEILEQDSRNHISYNLKKHYEVE